MSINILNLVEAYDEFISKAKLIKQVYNEIECIIIHPNLKLLNNIFKYVDKNVTETYIETIVRKANDNKFKLRKRTPFESNSYDISNIGLTDKVGCKWEKKILINRHSYVKDVLFAHSTEEENIIMPKDLMLDKMATYFVISVNMLIDNVRITYKIKHNVGSGSDKKLVLSSLFKNIEGYRKHTSISVDIEIVDLKLYNKNNVIKAFCYLFSVVNLDNLELNYEYNVMIKTNMLTLDELTTFSDTTLLKYMVTGKVDGETVLFKTDKYNCLVVINGIQYYYKCNLKNKIEGMGELITINKQSYIYPFYITNIDNEYDIRKHLLDKYNSLSFGTTAKIIFEKKKLHGPYDTLKQILSDSVEYFNNTSLYDGIILLDISNDKNVIDYKLKLDNTVDVVCVLNTTNGIYTTTEKGLYLTIDIYEYNKSFVNISTIRVKKTDSTDIINNIFYYDNVAVPIIFIGEYSFVTNTILRVREYKTTKFYYSNYNGNSVHVINKSKSFHESCRLFNIEYIKSLANTKGDTHNTFNNYFLEETERTSLNIATNIAKTNIISLACSSLVTSYPKKTVLSIDIGRGGDLNKYYYVGIKNLVGTDPDTVGLAEAKRRYDIAKTSRKKKSSIYNLSLENITVLDINYIELVKKHNNGNKFNIIDWQFAIHYSYDNNTKRDILNKLRSLSYNKTRVLITCLDGDKVDNMLTDSLLTFNITNKYTYNIKRISTDKIAVNYTASMGKYLIENLMRKTELINDFKEYGFELVDLFHFDMFINKNNTYIYEVLSASLRDATSKFYTKILGDKNLLINKDISKLLSLHMAITFEKRDSIIVK